MSAAAIGDVVIVEHSRFARVHAALAVTRRNAIYLDGSAQCLISNPELTLHEYYHVLCQWNTGELTVPRYLAEWVRQGLSYDRIAYEVRAREFAASRLARYRALLQSDADAATLAAPQSDSSRDDISKAARVSTGGDG